MSTFRAFIAIPLPDEVQTFVGGLCQTWSEQIPERTIRWVKPQLMHITLRFLGDTELSNLPALVEVLDGVGFRHDAFALHLDRPGCFPNEKRPRVIWVGLQGQLDAAGALKQNIDEALVPLGWDRENRPFRPHLTVGRVKKSRNVKGVRWEADVKPLTIPVKEIHLIESVLQRTGPVYTVRHKSVLHL